MSKAESGNLALLSTAIKVPNFNPGLNQPPNTQSQHGHWHASQRAKGAWITLDHPQLSRPAAILPSCPLIFSPPHMAESL